MSQKKQLNPRTGTISLVPVRSKQIKNSSKSSIQSSKPVRRNLVVTRTDQELHADEEKEIIENEFLQSGLPLECEEVIEMPLIVNQEDIIPEGHFEKLREYLENRQPFPEEDKSIEEIDFTSNQTPTIIEPKEVSKKKHKSKRK